MSQDVRAFIFDSAGTVAQTHLVSSTDQGDIVQGLALLAQRVAIELLTDKGSMPYLPERGTTFVSKLRNGLIRSDFDLLVAFSAAVGDLAKNLRNEESPLDRTDERFGLLSLRKVELDGAGGVRLHMSLQARNGQTASLSLPIQVKI